MQIDPESQTRLMNDLKAISFPRLLGTEGEVRARDWIKNQITQIGYKFRTQPFETSYFRINTFQQIGNLIPAILFLLSAWLFDIHPLLFVIPLVIIFFTISKISSGSLETAQPPNVPKFVKHFDTENIIVQTPRNAQNIDIIFVGHLDSKSTVYNGFTRVLLYLILMFGALGVLLIGIVGIILYAASIAIPDNVSTFMWIIAIIGACSGFLLLFNVVGNKSPGACDNGTAVAILLELLRYYKAHPLPNANLTFLFSSAEETGLTGAYVYAKQLSSDASIDKKKVFVINWDLAGLPGPLLVSTGMGIPKRITSPKMAKLLEEIDSEQKLSLKQAYLPIGGWTDALPFTHFGFDAITFSGKTVQIHTKNDIPEIIDPTNFYMNCMLGVELAKKLTN